MTKKILVTGASGYIGGRLVPELVQAGHTVRCAVRNPDKLAGMPWFDDVETVQADLSDAAATRKALKDIDVAYYLVHAMGDSRSFAKKDERLARQFAELAEDCGVERIVYLGGLGNDADPYLSAHLRSRHQVGEALRSSTVPVTELRAAVIIGSGSASFEMLRNIVERLPAMVAPRWLRTRCQPIAIRDVLFYLRRTIEVDETAGKTIEIGGPEVLTYAAMMQTYASVAKLRPRLIVTVPLLTPKLSSYWIGLVTPLPVRIAQPLVRGLSSEVIVRKPLAAEPMPHECLAFRESLELAVRRMRDLEVTTSWANAELSWRSAEDPMPADPEWSGGTVLDDEQTAFSDLPPHEVYESVCSIGGERGWLVTDYLWRARGLIDKVVGGVGMRRGRRHPTQLRVGDAVDFWRVEALVPDKLVRLRAEMRLPGRAWLEWTIDEHDGKTRLTQRARYQPRGIPGRLYWYALLPFHGVIFKGLAAQLAKNARPVAQPSPG